MKKRKTISQRLLALTLCLLCLLAALPIAALADDAAEPTTEPATLVTPAPSEPDDADPSDPSDPDEPVESSQPSEPEASSEPSEPEASSEPSEPENSEPQPSEITEPSEPETSEPTETTAPAETEDQTDPVQALYEQLMACQTLDEINAILYPETEEEQAAVDALIEQFTEEQQQSLMAYMAAIGYYDSESLDQKRSYTITQGDSKFVSVDNIQTDGFSYSCSPTTSGITVTPSSSYFDSGYTITVGNNVEPGTYTLKVNYTTRTGSWWSPSTQKYTDTVTITVKKNASGYQYDQKYYANPNFEHVAWDVVGSYSDGKPSSGKDNAQSYVESVKMANNAVDWAESDTNYTYPGRRNNNPKRAGKTLDTYFGENVTSNTPSASITLSITPKAGYYITGYWIVCCNGSTPYNCAVMRDGNEHSASFSFADSGGGTVEATVWSEYFGHPDERDDQYFIIIAVSPVPTPLFVDYNYGIIKDAVAETDKSIFTTPTSWTTTASGNNYGNGKVDTQNTQYRYTYTKTSESANWKHYANSITEEAKQAAWNAGYYFAGWKAEYYANANEKSITNDPDGKNYNYNLSSKYSAEKIYQEGADVQLLMHVKLTAQWLPIEMKLTKTVTGLTGTDFASDAHTYKIQLQQKAADGTWQDIGNPQELTVTGDGSATITFSPVTPGTYRAVELAESRGNLTKGNKTMYVTVTDSGEVTYGATPGEVTTQVLEVKNDYAATSPTATITITKQISGNMLSKNDEFRFTITGNSVADQPTEFTLKHGEVKEITVNIGDTIKIEEATGNYNTTYKIGENGTEQTGSVAEITVTGDQTITFTNTHNVTIDTGILLDTLPYILILAVVALGAGMMLRKRRSRDED